jgi:hypothetical protein
VLVRALVSFFSPHGSAHKGETLDVSPDLVEQWVRVGLVERADRPEMAVRSTPETAVTRKARR